MLTGKIDRSKVPPTQSDQGILSSNGKNPEPIRAASTRVMAMAVIQIEIGGASRPAKFGRAANPNQSERPFGKGPGL